jgi:hypothetical protein
MTRGSGRGRKAAHMTEGPEARPVPRAQRHLLLADLDGALYQLFSITFTRDGIFVNFPYHPDAPGAACLAPVEPTGAVAVNLDAVTSTTTHRVKYTHHVDGRAALLPGQEDPHPDQESGQAPRRGHRAHVHAEPPGP